MGLGVGQVVLEGVGSHAFAMVARREEPVVGVVREEVARRLELQLGINARL